MAGDHSVAKSINLIIKEKENLQETLVNYPFIYDSNQLFIQVYVYTNNIHRIVQIQEELKHLFPSSKMIGCTVNELYIDGSTLNKEEALFTFTLFEQTEIHTDIIKNNHFQFFNDHHRKLHIIFSTETFNIEPLHNQLSKQFPHSEITGLTLGANNYIFDHYSILDNGAIVASFSSEGLIIHKEEIGSWKEIGPRFQVTNVMNNKVLSINHLTPKELHQEYFGKMSDKEYERHIKEFPFILHKHSEQKILLPVKIDPKGFLVFDESIQIGDELSFAYFDIHTWLNNHEFFSKTSANQVDFFLSFPNRPKFESMKEVMAETIKVMKNLAPVTGYFSDKNWSQMSSSFCLLRISEKKNSLSKKSYQRMIVPDKLIKMAKITHLLERLNKENSDLSTNNRLSEQYYESLFNNNEDIIYSTDLNGKILSVNQAFIDTFGYQKNEIIGKLALNYIDTIDIQRVKVNFFRALKGQIRTYRLKIKTKLGEELVVIMKNIPITVGGKVVGTYGIGRDITESVKNEEKVKQLAYYDIDTGLPNRLKFTEILNNHMKHAKRTNQPFAVMFVDIDRFKMINDTLGYKAGDEILKELSLRLNKLMPEHAQLGRFSGDKFSILIKEYHEPKEMIQFCEQVLRAINLPIEYSGQEYFVASSIGISIYPHDGVQTEILLKHADLALNRCKLQGGNNYSFYSTEMNDQVKLRIEMESHLRRALEKDEFFLCYQPIYQLKSGKIFGSEALIRWNHPKLGLIPPNEFIPLAEETGLIRDIGRWVLIESCKQNKKWHDVGLRNLIISVNVSPKQFQHEMFLSDVKEALSISGMSPEYLHLELTESVMLGNISYSVSVMKELQRLGVKVSIDDFGKGYSSLNYLRNLPANIIKIDRSFIKNIHQDSSHMAIVKAIITMGKGLSMKVIAEGVETKEQWELLKKLNCHYAQGYYIHKPLKANEFVKKINVS